MDIYIYIYMPSLMQKKSDVQLEALISQSSIIINWELQKNGKYIFFYFF